MTEPDIESLENTLESLRQNSEVSGQFQILSELAQAYQARRKFQKALTYSREALNLVKGLEKSDDRIFALVNMGCIYWEMAQLKKAIGYFQGALELAKEMEDDTGRKALSAIMGISYWRKGEWSVAFNWFAQALPAWTDDTSKSDQAQADIAWKYAGLHIVMERGIATLENRIRMAKDQQDLERTLLPSFSMVPIMYFTGRKENIPLLLEEIISLAQQLNKTNILDAIPQLQNLLGNG